MTYSTYEVDWDYDGIEEYATKVHFSNHPRVVTSLPQKQAKREFNSLSARIKYWLVKHGQTWESAGL